MINFALVPRACGRRIVAIASLFALMLPLCSRSQAAEAGSPITVPLVERMPDVPQPFQIIDWKARARAFDGLAFDPDAKGLYLPLLAWIKDPVNIQQLAFAMPAYVGSPAHRGEGIGCIGAVVGASLVGIDKSKPSQRNWVVMCEEWFNVKNGMNIVLNNPHALNGSFWYDVFPGVLFCQLADRYPDCGSTQRIMQTMASRWQEACSRLGGKEGKIDFNYTTFDLAAMKPVFNGRWREPDGAAGIAWIEYMAWVRWRKPEHLEGARWCMAYLDRRKAEQGSPLYEILLYYAPVLAARMNAEIGTRYDVEKLVNWCLSENLRGDVPRPAWGTIARRFGQYDCAGLVGGNSINDGYAFAMNTFHAAGAMAPLARYDQRYARAMGKWLLNVANNARLFYPDAWPADHQSDPGGRSDPANVICYEGLRERGLALSSPLGEKTGQGRAGRGNFTEAGKPQGEETLVADEHGRLDHVWEFKLPADLVDGAVWVELRSITPNGTWTVSSATMPEGPFQPLFSFPRDGDRLGEKANLGAGLPGVRQQRKLYLKLASLPGKTPPGAEIVVQNLRLLIHTDKVPYATGDPTIMQWGPKTNLCIYGASHVGYLAALIERTNHERILQIDLLATDFFRDRAYPTYLYFNPDEEAREVEIALGPAAKDLYETTTHRLVAHAVQGKATFRVPGKNAVVIVLAPAGGKLEHRHGKTLIDGVIVDHRP